MKSNQPAPPQHLSKSARDWWSSVVEGYELQPHHLRLLEMAAEAWDSWQRARQRLEQDGDVQEDRFGFLRPHPCVAMARDSRIAFSRLLRELGLDYSDVPKLAPGRPGKGSMGA